MSSLIFHQNLRVFPVTVVGMGSLRCAFVHWRINHGLAAISIPTIITLYRDKKDLQFAHCSCYVLFSCKEHCASRAQQCSRKTYLSNLNRKEVHDHGQDTTCIRHTRR